MGSNHQPVWLDFLEGFPDVVDGREGTSGPKILASSRSAIGHGFLVHESDLKMTHFFV